MKVKIKKDGKAKSYNIVESWEDVTLEKFMQLSLDTEKTTTQEVEETIAILSDLPRKLIKELSLKDVANLFERVSSIEMQTEGLLTKIIEIDGKEYGMHPDLSEITLGEYADIETFINEGLKKHLPEIMAILFRPVIDKEGEAYAIEAYDGKITTRAEKMKKMSAEQVQSVLVFFWTFVRIFIAILPLSLMEEVKRKVKSLQPKDLQKSGDGSE
jgi:hypothetical protein